MEVLGKITQLIVHLGAFDLTFNLNTILMTWIVIGVLTTFGFLAARKARAVPGPLQVMGEMVIAIFYGLTEDALGKKLARTYSPFICALFMFVLVSNWLGVIPHLHEPTKDLNTPLSLGLMGFCIAHYAGIRAKGCASWRMGPADPGPSGTRAGCAPAANATPTATMSGPRRSAFPLTRRRSPSTLTRIGQKRIVSCII